MATGKTIEILEIRITRNRCQVQDARDRIPGIGCVQAGKEVTFDYVDGK